MIEIGNIIFIGIMKMILIAFGYTFCIGLIVAVFKGKI